MMTAIVAPALAIADAAEVDALRGRLRELERENADLRAAVVELSENPSFGMLNQGGLVRALRDVTEPVGIVFCDGDQFKAWNSAGERLGLSDEDDPFAFTDRLVRWVFAGLRRASDVVIGQRKSGDEWVVVVPLGDEHATAQYLLERFRATPLSDEERAAIGAVTNGAVDHFSATIAVASGPAEQAIRLAHGRVMKAKALGQRDCLVTERMISKEVSRG